ncbi:MAG: sugar ABC transporter permease [Eubacteriales bacterium]|nr:sugar ABC transporter permease [Eubacteriales bacterium]
MEKTLLTHRKLTLNERTSRKGIWFVLPFVILYAVFNLFPLLYTLYLSFYSWDGIGTKAFVGISNYLKIFKADRLFWTSFKNVFLIVIGYLPVTLLLAFVVAVLLYSKNLKLRRTFQTCMFLPYVVVPVAVGMLFSMLFGWQSGTVNALLMKLHIISEPIDWLGSQTYARGVVILLQIWKTFGYVTTLYLSALTSLPSDVMDAAAIDGCKFKNLLFHVILPMLKEITMFIVITTLIDGLQLFDAVKVLFTAGNTGAAIGGPGRTCLTPVWYLYYTAFGSSATRNFGYASAISYVLFAVIMLFSVIVMIPNLRSVKKDRRQQ